MQKSLSNNMYLEEIQKLNDRIKVLENNLRGLRTLVLKMYEEKKGVK